MKKSILAGILIAMSGTIYMIVGGIIGAFLFSLGLITILYFQLELFTGKIGLLPYKEITIIKLIEIYIGNYIGVTIVAILMLIATLFNDIGITSKAIEITQNKLDYHLFTNLILGIFCGLLMYIAVNLYKTFPIGTMFAVATFILMGANHCIADMYYFSLALVQLRVWRLISVLAATTIGNIIGGMLIPYLLRKSSANS